MAGKNNPSGPSGRQSHTGDEGALGGMASTVKGAAGSVMDTAEEAWDSTREGVQRAASAVADTAGNAWDEVTGLMRRYPFGTLCVGIGLGFVLSRLLEDRGMRDVRRFGSEVYDRLRDYASDVASKASDVASRVRG